MAIEDECRSRPFNKYVQKLRPSGDGGPSHIQAPFAVPLIIMLLAAGPLIDYSRTFIVQHQLNQAINIAALKINAATKGLNGNFKENILRHLRANFPAGNLAATNVDLVREEGKTKIIASTSVPTLVMGFVGITSMNVGTQSEIDQPIHPRNQQADNAGNHHKVKRDYKFVARGPIDIGRNINVSYMNKLDDIALLQ